LRIEHNLFFIPHRALLLMACLEAAAEAVCFEQQINEVNEKKKQD
jgi:hypothetical protein